MEKFGRIALIVVVAASIAVLVFVGPCTKLSGVPVPTGTVSAPQLPAKVFTRAELSKYSGKNGQPAYVAVNDIVYDITGSTFFPNGVHRVCEGETVAGQDATEQMGEAPPGMREMLLRFPIVGTMAGAHVTPPKTTAVPQKTFTAAELARYNGQNGQPAYVGADGWVYDVTTSPWWAGGQHSVCKLSSMAGHDLTQALNMAPRSMRTLLQRFPVVGKLQ